MVEHRAHESRHTSIDTIDPAKARARVEGLEAGHYDKNRAAQATNLSAQDCEALAVVGTPSQRRALARNPATPPHVLDWLAEHHHDTWSDVARHREVTLAALRRIHSVPKKLGTMAEALAWCAERGHLHVVAAGNPNTPPEIVERLASADSASTRMAAAGNAIELSRETLDKLAEDHVWGVRNNLAGNPKTPVDILERLAADPILEVRHAVEANPSTPPALAKRLRKARPLQPTTKVLIATSTGILLIATIIILFNVWISCAVSP